MASHSAIDFETRVEIAHAPQTWRQWLRRNLMVAGIPLVVALDWLIINAVFALVYALRFTWQVVAPVENGPPWTPYWHATLLMATIWVMVLAASGLYKHRRAASKFDDLMVLAFGLGLGTLIALALGFFYRDFSYSRLVLVYSLVLSYVALGGTHLILRSIQGWLQARGWGVLNTLIVGCNSLGEMMAVRFKESPHLGHRLVGFVPAPGETMEEGRWICPVNTGDLRESHAENYGEVLGDPENLPTLVEKYQIDEVILARPGATFTEFVELMGSAGTKRDVRFRIVPDVFELMTAKIQISDLDGVPTLEIWDVPLRKWHNRVIKRTMDIMLSALGMLAISPLLIVTAIAVKLSSPGPIFYRQERMGRDGRLFNIYKFRTMRTDAETASGPVWAKEGDPRTTRIGAILRRLSIDELPQLWNVLIGDMSLVGPRPERPFFIDQFRTYIPKYMDRHLVRSGLTGWAQANGLRGEEGTIEERTRYDIYYVENWSLLFDLRIIVKTALELFFHKAY